MTKFVEYLTVKTEGVLLTWTESLDLSSYVPHEDTQFVTKFVQTLLSEVNFIDSDVLLTFSNQDNNGRKMATPLTSEVFTSVNRSRCIVRL